MNKYPFLLLFLAFVFTGCPGDTGNNNVVKVYNDSDYSILAYIGDGVHDGGTIYPDTLLPVSNYTRGIPTRGVNVGICAIDYVRELYIDNQDTICFFLLDEKMVETHGWDVVYEDYNILARYDLSLDDMELLNFEISYPPRGEMKDMKMYPPYDTFKKATTDPTVSIRY